MRADRYASDGLGLFTRSQFKARNARVKLNGARAKGSSLVRSGDLVELEWEDERAVSLAAEDIPLDVLYEDERVIVLDKAQGMVVHPAHGNPSGTLVNALLFRSKAEAGSFPDPGRAGVVHRLDKDTSGVIIMAKDARALEFLAAQFRARTVTKRYIAIVRGRPQPESGRIANRIERDAGDRKAFRVVPGSELAGEGGVSPGLPAAGPKARFPGAMPPEIGRTRGRFALSDYRTLADYSGYCLLALAPKTGRTHQLRVHLRHIGTPILGDPIYSKKDPRFPDASLMLHARSLTIVLPSTLKAATFGAAMPERFKKILGELGGDQVRE